MVSVNGLQSAYMCKWEGESRLPVSVREWCLNTGRTPSVVLHFAPKPQGSNDLPPLHFISLPSLVPWPKGGEKSIKTKAWSKRPQHKHAICTGLGVSMTSGLWMTLYYMYWLMAHLTRINDGFGFQESHDVFTCKYTIVNHFKKYILIHSFLQQAG